MLRGLNWFSGRRPHRVTGPRDWFCNRKTKMTWRQYSPPHICLGHAGIDKQASFWNLVNVPDEFKCNRIHDDTEEAQVAHCKKWRLSRFVVLKR